MTNRHRIVAILCLLSLLTLGGCASKKDDSAEKQEPVETMYNRAAAKLDAGSTAEAAKEFDAVEQNYPYSQWATRAQLMASYAYYKELKYDEALMALERFIDLHPGDESSVYAYYLRALCYYEQISDVRRDQKMTELALDSLRQVKTRFPDSQYAKDAALKIDLTLDHLAGKEMEIGRYYLYRKQYQAAINRFEKVVEQYQTTSHVPEALERLTEAYTSLGIMDEARKTAAILGQNYPQSSWYRDSYRLAGDPLPEPPKKPEDPAPPSVKVINN
ncbi:MAG: outer membrane protein assembly factor BamD [Proteobacteria bacterium]|nr:outer membrane protein assembly factor BamD [Pseudomonadota bacterium]